MSAPQMKERPASMLRSMFAGLGSLLNVMDKVRSKPAKQQTPARPETKAEPAATPPAAAEPEATTVAEPEAAPAAEAAPVTAEPEVTPETLAEAEDALADVDDTDVDDVATVDAVTEDTPAEDPAPADGTVEPEIVLIETDVVTVETDPVTGEPEAVVVETEIVALPLVNYDELSVASLRARLRNLSVGQLGDLLDYEKTHAARPDVITMFERRIAKVQAES
jgi:hypothetical protein